MKRVVALILAGGQGDRLSVLSEERAKPAVIYGGRYRIIDFALSNCVNSTAEHVGCNHVDDAERRRWDAMQKATEIATGGRV